MYAQPQHSMTMTARLVYALAIFLGAYFTTITVNAQPASDAIYVGTENQIAVNGTVTAVEPNALVIDAAGKQMRVELDRMKLNTDPDGVFQTGMSVAVTGRTAGESFGLPLIKADSVTAVEGK